MDSLSQTLDELAKVHTWDESKGKEERANVALDEFFAKDYEIIMTRKILDLNGIDRLFNHRHTPQRFTIEYKNDFRSEESGNLFIELQSNEGANSPGWIFTCLSQVLIWHIPHLREVIWLNFLHLKRAAYLWERNKEYKIGHCQNPNYTSSGLCVPIEECKKLGKVFDIKRVYGDGK